MRWVLLLALVVFISGCSPKKIILPYEEEKLCNKGVGYGVCGSLSDVYKDTFEHPELYGIEKRRR